MATNLDYLNGNPASETRGLPEKLSPVEKELELMAQYTMHDFKSSYEQIKGLDNPIFPLSIEYMCGNEDTTKASVRLSTSQDKIIYSSPKMPVFRAVSLAHKLQNLFKRNNYGCNIEKELVKED